MWWLTFLHDLCSAMSPQSCPVLTLKKLLLLSVRPQEGFLGCELEAMLSSCQQDSVLLPFRSASAEAGALWDTNMFHFRHLSCGAPRGNSSFGHSRGYSDARLLGIFDCHSPPLLPSPFFILGWTAVLWLPVSTVSSPYHIFTLFIPSSCSHVLIPSFIIYFPSRTASVPTQLLSFPTHQKLTSPNMRKRKCLVVFNFHKVKTETGLHPHIFKISFMVFIFVSLSLDLPFSAARLKLLRLALSFPAEVHSPGESGQCAICPSVSTSTFISLRQEAISPTPHPPTPSL